MRRVERAMYLTAAMTGLRQGELFALRWMDIDWLARKVRVRRSYVRGSFGTPKSKRSSRAVPLADRVARELELLSQASEFQGEEDLVFGHPHTGGAARPLTGLEALQVRAEARWRARGQVSRPKTYFRYTLRCERRRDADDPGVDGSSRHQDDADLRRLRAGRERARPHQRCLRRGDLRGD